MEANPDLLRNAIRQHLEGEDFFAGFSPRPEGGAVPTSNPAPGKEARPRCSSAAELSRLNKTVSNCQKCQLSKTRTHAVPGEGNNRAFLMFIGEAPGRDEDQQGRPFVGRAGQLLDKIIVACGLARGDVFIANTLKCCPPENRDPRPDEIDCCLPYLCHQIELIAPKVIVALGAHATRTVTGSELDIERLAGQFHACALVPDEAGISVMPTYDPDYLLRNYSTENRRRVWEDMKKVMERLELRSG